MSNPSAREIAESFEGWIENAEAGFQPECDYREGMKKFISAIESALKSYGNQKLEEAAQYILTIDNVFLGPQHREKLANEICRKLKEE